MTTLSDETAEDGGRCAPLGGSVMVVEMSGNEPEEQCEDIAWQMFCNAHPVEAYQHNPDGFWKYFHARAPDMSREQMVALLKKCEEPESESPNADFRHGSEPLPARTGSGHAELE